jgi:hypothetical protein
MQHTERSPRAKNSSRLTVCGYPKRNTADFNCRAKVAREGEIWNRWMALSNVVIKIEPPSSPSGAAPQFMSWSGQPPVARLLAAVMGILIG